MVIYSSNPTLYPHKQMGMGIAAHKDAICAAESGLWGCRSEPVCLPNVLAVCGVLQKGGDDGKAVSDQWLPPFVIEKDGKPVGTVEDGDAVVCLDPPACLPSSSQSDLSTECCQDESNVCILPGAPSIQS